MRLGIRAVGSSGLGSMQCNICTRAYTDDQIYKSTGTRSHGSEVTGMYLLQKRTADRLVLHLFIAGVN